MIYRFRIILDDEEDVFRDIEIEASSTLEDFHNAITQSFGFDGNEMASFYKSNELWEEGEEISLFDLGDVPGESRIMSETTLKEVVSEDETRMIYVYDFMNMWTFMVELADIAEYEEGQSYPNLMFAHGQISFSDMKDDEEYFDDDSNDEDDFYSEDYSLDSEDYEDLGFEENWN